MMYNRTIKYGDYTEMQWKTLNGLTCVDKELKEIAQLCGPEYDAWVVGGILEDRPTQDLDIIITGPNNPERINYLLEEIVYLGFKNQVWIDVKYSVTGKIFIPSQYNIGMGKLSFLWASYQPEITIKIMSSSSFPVFCCANFVALYFVNVKCSHVAYYFSYYTAYT